MVEIKKIEGIILSENNYSESSKILNVLTKDYGLISVISKGCRKIKSKLRSVSSVLTYGNFHLYYKEKGLSNLTEVDLIDSFKNIKENLDNISYASYLTELTLQVVKHHEDREIYNIFISSLKKINEGLSPSIISSIVEVKYLEYLGVKPSIDACSICGNNKDIVTISSTKGGYICKNCLDDDFIVSEKCVKLIRMFYYVDIDSITKLDIKNDTMKEINKFIDEYYEDYTGLYLNSKKFLKNLSKI